MTVGVTAAPTDTVFRTILLLTSSHYLFSNLTLEVFAKLFKHTIGK